MASTGSLIATVPGPAGSTRVRVRGRLDADAVGRLRGLLEDAEGSAVRIDLSRSADLPVDALRVLAAAHRRRLDGPGRLVLEQPSRAARRSLRVSGLDRVLTVAARPGARGTRSA